MTASSLASPPRHTEINVICIDSVSLPRTGFACRVLTALVSAGMLTCAFAQQPDSETPGQQAHVLQPAPEPDIGKGDATRTWLRAQGQKEQATAHPPRLSGPVMSKIHERYVKSFTTPIPEKFPTASK